MGLSFMEVGSLSREGGLLEDAMAIWVSGSSLNVFWWGPSM